MKVQLHDAASSTRASSGSARGWGTLGGAVGGAVIFLFVGLAPLAYWRGLYEPYDLPKDAVFGVFALSCVTISLAIVAWLRGRRASLPGEVLLFGGFLTVAAVSLSRSQTPAEGVDALRQGVQLLAWWIFGCLWLRTPGRLRAAVAAVAVAGFLTGVLGLAQRFGWDVALNDWVRREGLVEGLLPFVRLQGNDGPASAFGHPNFAAQVVLMGAIAALGLLWRPRRRLTSVAAVVLGLGLVTSGLYLLVAGTRSAWVALPAAGLALVVLRYAAATDPRTRRRIAGGATLCAVGAVVAFAVAGQWIATTGRGGGPDVHPFQRVRELVDPDRGTLLERRTLWANTLTLVRESPVLGVGPGNWKIEYPRVGRSAMIHDAALFSLQRQPDHVHNDPLQLLSETGVAGLLLLGSFFAVSFLRLLRRALATGDLAWEAATTVAVIAGILTVSLFSFPFQKAVPASLCFFLLGAGAALGGGRGRWEIPLGKRGARLGAVLAAVASMVVAASLWARIQASSDYLVALAMPENALAGVQDRSVLPLSDRELLVRALDAADRAATREPANYRYQLQRAKVLRLLGLGDHASAVLERTLELHPNLGNAMIMRASLLQAQQRYGDAERLLQRARSVFPESSEVYFALGRLYHEAGMRVHRGFLVEAQRAYELAIGDREHAPIERLHLARLLLEEGAQPERIVALVGKTEENSAANPAHLAACARIYADPRLGAVSGLFGAVGNKTLAVWRGVSALTGDRDLEARMELGLVPLKRHQAGATPEPPAEELSRMLAVVEGVLRESPRHLSARYYHALLLEKLGHAEESLLEWGRLARSAIATDPGGSGAAWVIEAAMAATERLRKAADAEAGAQGSSAEDR